MIVKNITAQKTTAVKKEAKKEKSKQFLEKPEYPGGKKALDDFVKAHLQYPEDAMQQRIEGTVRVEYQVSDDGEVLQATVVKGLCPSCDAEALRIVRLLQYGKAHNRGIRLKANCKININFHLAPIPQQPTINITLTQTSSSKKKKPQQNYGYSIRINN